MRSLVWRAGLGGLALALAATACAVGQVEIGFNTDDDAGPSQTKTDSSTGSPRDGGAEAEAAAPAACSNATECDDKDPCTTDTCELRKCKNVPVDFDDKDPCTTDSCNADAGVRHVPVSVDDNNMCTTDSCSRDAGIVHTPKSCPPSTGCNKIACTPSTGNCDNTPVTTCINNDGCCPSGCTFANDNDCNCSVNLATTATGSGSSGSTSSSYGPQNMNDGIRQNACTYFMWVTNGSTPSGAFVQYTWSSAVTIGSIYVETGIGSCSSTSGRNIASGTVQWWDGATWQTSTTFSGKTDDFQLDLPAAVTTTRLRIYDMTTSGGNGNSIVHEWFVYPGRGCAPP